MQELFGCAVHVFEAIVAKHDIEILVSVDERPGHIVKRSEELSFFGSQSLLGDFLLSDVGHNRNGSTIRCPSTLDAQPTTVRRMIFKALA